jgi:zinc transport system ATP-binding protein
MPDALTVEHLTVKFGATEVIRDLSFKVESGTTLAIIGPNGAGKTVLFRALIGAIPHEGMIQWSRGTKIGYVPQRLDIERDLPLSGRDFLRAKAAISKAARHDVADALAAVGLDHSTVSAPIGTMSGGQFQRLLVAFALIGNPNVLLLDEPAAGIDGPGQEKLNAIIERLQKERHVTVLLISHELNVVYDYATAVLCMGRTQTCFGVPQNVLTPEMLQELYGTATGFYVHEHLRN